MMTATASSAADAPRHALLTPLSSETTSKLMPRNVSAADFAQMHVRSTL